MSNAETQYLTKRGDRVYRVQQMLNDTLNYRIVTVPLAEAKSSWVANKSVQQRWSGFRTETEAQAALDAFAREGALKPWESVK